MGGKKRGASHQRKRADVAASELVEANAEAQLSLASFADSELFVLDTNPDLAALKPSRKDLRRLAAEKSIEGKTRGRKRKVVLSEQDMRQVKKLMEAHDKEKVTEIAEQGKKSLTTCSNKKPKNADFDLWTADEQASGSDSIKKKAIPSRKAARKTNTVAIDVAHSGQSYRPDEELHQDIIGEALAIELRRNEAMEYEKTPIASGMSEETLAVLVGDDDVYSSSDDDDEDGNKTFTPKTTREKLTKAQRNKRKRVKQMQLEHEERKRTKKLLNSVNNVKSIRKEIEREEREHTTKNEEVKRLKEEARAKPLGKNLHSKLVEKDPIKAPTLPVALTSELKDNGGTLRTVKPKGDLLSERLHSFAARKMANEKRTKRNNLQGKRRKVGKGREYLLI